MRKVITAGGIVIKKVEGILYICLVYHEEGGLVIPKGHLDPGESLEECAQREVHEETGLHILGIVKKLGVVLRKAEEDNGEVVDKEIHLYHIHTSLYQDEDPEEKYDWFTKEEAVAQMKYKEEADFINEYFNESLYEEQ